MDSILQEILLCIVDHLSWSKSLLSPYVTVSRRWQLPIERLLFRVFYIDDMDIPIFASLFRPSQAHRKGFVKSIDLHVTLPDYDRINTHQQQKANHQVYSNAVFRLFQVLTSFDGDEHARSGEAHVQETGRWTIGAIFAADNSLSIDVGIEFLEKHGLDKRRSRHHKLVVSNEAAGSISFAQIYGMKDDLTNKITGSITTKNGFLLVVKSMSYGQLKECLPFLARRATENKAVLEGRGGATVERVRIGREFRRRLSQFT